MEETALRPSLALRRLVNGYQVSQAIHVAARLGQPAINLLPTGLLPDGGAPAGTRTIGARTEHLRLEPHERAELRAVRFRTVGDAACTGALESTAATVADVILETAMARTSERGSRADDLRSDSAMEDRKRGGYF